MKNINAVFNIGCHAQRIVVFLEHAQEIHTRQRQPGKKEEGRRMGSNNDLRRNGSGYRDPTAYEAILNVSRERKNGGKEMTTANKIDISQIKSYEITIAKCGALVLKWIASPDGASIYEVYAGNSDIPVVKTNSLYKAIEEYNKRVI